MSSETLSTLDAFFAEGWITEILYEVKSGKEATVYCCEGDPTKGQALFAAKIYRSRQHRNFKNDAVYQQGRVINDRRMRRAFERKTQFGREVQAAAWTDHEFDTLRTLHAAGAAVPRPVASSPGALLMDFVGDEHGAAPPLHTVSPAPDEARRLFGHVMRNVELWLACDRVHGDLSAFNMLYWRGSVTVIDFPQVVDPRANPDARDLLARDIANVCRYFARHGVRADPARLADDLWRRFTRAEL